MKTNLLVIGAIIAISAIMITVPTATSMANAICAGTGSTKACAGDFGAFAKTSRAIATAFEGLAFAFAR